MPELEDDDDYEGSGHQEQQHHEVNNDCMIVMYIYTNLCTYYVYVCEISYVPIYMLNKVIGLI